MSTCDDATLSTASFVRSEEHTSELQSQFHLVCRLLLEKKKNRPTPPGCRRPRLAPPGPGVRGRRCASIRPPPRLHPRPSPLRRVPAPARSRRFSCHFWP